MAKERAYHDPIKSELPPDMTATKTSSNGGANKTSGLPDARQLPAKPMQKQSGKATGFGIPKQSVPAMIPGPMRGKSER